MAFAVLGSIRNWASRNVKILASVVGVAVEEATGLVPGGRLVGVVLAEVARYGVQRLLNRDAEVPGLKKAGEVFPIELLEKIDSSLQILVSSHAGLLEKLNVALGPLADQQADIKALVKRALQQDNALAKEFADCRHQIQSMVQSLGRIETIVTETHEVTLDIRKTLEIMLQSDQQQGAEMVQLLRIILAKVDEHGMSAGVVQPQHSFSIRGADEKQLVRRLLQQFRALPAAQQQRVPAVLNGLGKLVNGTGEYGGAQAIFLEVADNVQEDSLRAEALYNAYRAGLEAEKWDDALQAIVESARLDPRRFAPFPLNRFQPQRILGAGGFGAAFLCLDAWLGNQPVVVKPLHDADLSRTVGDVFNEAVVLQSIHHQSVITMRDPGYAVDPNSPRPGRPYIVMDYFDGTSLQKWIQEHGKLSLHDSLAVATRIAEAMRTVHARAVFHRDLKPDNVLVKKDGTQLLVKIIDFGLALKQQTIQTSAAAGIANKTILSESVAGTLDFAPPEQLGKSTEPVGPYSDVYAFGKLFYAMHFGTPTPDDDEREGLPVELRTLLSRCTSQSVAKRPRDFVSVISVLKDLDSGKEQRSMNGDEQLVLLLRQVYDRTDGKPTKDDENSVKQFCRDHGLTAERAQHVVKGFREQWRKANPATSSKGEPPVGAAPPAFPAEDDWVAVTAKLQTNRTESHRQARALADKGDYAAALQVLQGLPENLRDTALVDLWRRQIERVQKLDQAIKQAAREGRIDGLRFKVRALLDLQPEREDLKRFLKQHGEPCAGEPYPLELAPGCTMAFAWIPPGSFEMGSPANEAQRSDDEVQHRVTLTKGFLMAVHPVTRGQFSRFVEGQGYKTEAEREGGAYGWTGSEWKLDARYNWLNPGFQQEDNHPVVCVSWNDAVAFCTWLTKKTGGDGRIMLPTEAQWEYACRGGANDSKDTFPFYFKSTSRSLSSAQANFDGNNPYGGAAKGQYLQRTTRVESYEPNKLGLYDMHGNVWEWCQDWFGSYETSNNKDPQGADSGEARVLRGGSWGYDGDGCRAACRGRGAPGNRHGFFGFRVVLPLDF